MELTVKSRMLCIIKDLCLCNSHPLHLVREIMKLSQLLNERVLASIDRHLLTCVLYAGIFLCLCGKSTLRQMLYILLCRHSFWKSKGAGHFWRIYIYMLVKVYIYRNCISPVTQ